MASVNPLYRAAIAAIESAGSGGYGALGPLTNGDRAYGRYQVMGENIGPWTEQVLGQRLTPQQFVENPQAQDKVFDSIFGGYVNRYGPEGAAQAWFGGPGAVGKTDRKDALGTSVGDYGRRFLDAIGGAAPARQQQVPAGLLNEGQTPMANGRPGGLLDTISNGNPLLDLGIGILAASADQPFGKALATGAQFASERGRARFENDAMRQKLLDQQRQRNASQQLQGLLSSGEPVDVQSPQVIGLLAQIAPDAVASGLLGQAFPQPNALTGKIAAAESALGRPLNEQEVLAISGGAPSTVVNVGDKERDKPLSVSDLNSIRKPDGGKFPVGTTMGEAADAGAVSLTAEEAKAASSVDSAQSLLNELETLALGKDGETGVFTGAKPGLFNRLDSALGQAVELLDQNDPKVARYNDLATGSVARFVRLLGEAGALAEGDVQRALGLLPRAYQLGNPLGLPDTEEVARAKIKDLRSIIDKGVEKAKSLASPEGADAAPADQQQGDQPTGPTKAQRISRMSLDAINRLDPTQLTDEELAAALRRAQELAR